jgi:glycerophosphoryl diester phosphodiesterase
VEGDLRRVEIVAHRGASHLAPENTLAAVELAWDIGSDAVEVDVHLSADRRIVVIHDPTTQRTGGLNLEVAQTHSRDLRKLDVGGYQGRGRDGQSIPFLEEILVTVPAGRRLFVEIKTGPEMIPYLHALLDTSGKRRQVVLIAFELETLRAAKAVLPEVPAYWLRDTALGFPHRVAMLAQAREAGLEGVDVNWTGVTLRLAQQARSMGLDLYVWTVDDALVAQRLGRLGIKGITTNRPEWLLRAREHLHRDPLAAG